MIDSVLNVEVSCYPNRRDNRGKPVLLRTWLTSDKHWGLVKAIQAEADEARQKAMKDELICITPSALLNTKAKDVSAEQALEKHSGFIALDIDRKDNPDVDMIGLKWKIATISQVAYCGLSVRGNGLWVLVRIADPAQHTGHYEALKYYFNRVLGIVIDASKGGNVRHLRYYSYDPDAYLNDFAKTFDRTYTPTTKPTKPALPTFSRFSRFISEVLPQNITDGQLTRLFDTSTHSAEKFYRAGQHGKPAIHNYAENKTWYPVNAYRQKHGLTYYEALTALAAHYGFTQAVSTPTPAAAYPTSTTTITTQLCSRAGDSWPVEIGPHGYPQSWDEPNPPGAVPTIRPINLKDYLMQS